MFNNDLSGKDNDKYFGKCQNIHGHNYSLEVTVRGTIDKTKGYFVNINDLSNKIKLNIIDILDHKHLNDILPGCKNKPVTMEVISLWIWKTLNNKMPQFNFFKIKLWENEDNSAEIYK